MTPSARCAHVFLVLFLTTPGADLLRPYIVIFLPLVPTSPSLLMVILAIALAENST